MTTYPIPYNIPEEVKLRLVPAVGPEGIPVQYPTIIIMRIWMFRLDGAPSQHVRVTLHAYRYMHRSS